MSYLPYFGCKKNFSQKGFQHFFVFIDPKHAKNQKKVTSQSWEKAVKTDRQLNSKQFPERAGIQKDLRLPLKTSKLYFTKYIINVVSEQTLCNYEPCDFKIISEVYSGPCETFMFKVKTKDTRTTPLASFWCLLLTLNIFYTLF